MTSERLARVLVAADRLEHEGAQLRRGGGAYAGDADGHQQPAAPQEEVVPVGVFDVPVVVDDLIAQIVIRRGVALRAVQYESRLDLDVVAERCRGLRGVRLEGEVLGDLCESLVSDVADVGRVRIAAVRCRAPGRRDTGGQILRGEGSMAQLHRAEGG